MFQVGDGKIRKEEMLDAEEVELQKLGIDWVLMDGGVRFLVYGYFK